eukprot:PhM_4_TR1495/c0_g2_i1/m.2053/K01404/GP63; leishmanolysin
MPTLSTLLILLFTLYVVQAGAHRCYHEQHLRERRQTLGVTHNEATPNPHKMHSTAAWGSMRIHIFDYFATPANDRARACTKVDELVKVGEPTTSTALCEANKVTSNCYIKCTAADVPTQAMKDSLNTVLKDTTAWFSAALRVPTQTTPLRLTTECHSIAANQIPSELSTAGISNTDFVLMLTLRPNTHIPGVLAYAAFCTYDSTSRRPTIGYLNIDPSTILTNGDLPLVIKHELTHAFGFSSSAYVLWRYPGLSSFMSYKQYNATKYPTGPITGAAVRADWEMNALGPFDFNSGTDAYLVTPNVLAAAEKHFGCVGVARFSLEDGGSAATSGSHWEKRIMYYDYMTGSQASNGVISTISLAAFQDMGFYQVDMSKAGTLLWGVGQGCTFMEGSCMNWGDEYTCKTSKGLVSTCDYTGRYVSKCAVSTYTSDLPFRFRHFPLEPKKGGSDSLADYCPLIMPYATTGGGGDCRVEGNNPSPNQFSALAGSSSFCMMGSIVFSQALGSVEPSARCYPASCIGGSVHVIINGTWYDCGAKKSVSLTATPGPYYSAHYKGNITCPSIDCTKSTNVVSNFPRMTTVSKRQLSSAGSEELKVTGEFLTGCELHIGDVVGPELRVLNSTHWEVLTPSAPVGSTVLKIKCKFNPQCGSGCFTTLISVNVSKTEDPKEDNRNVLEKIIDNPGKLGEFPGLGVLLAGVLLFLVFAVLCCCRRAKNPEKMASSRGQDEMVNASEMQLLESTSALFSQSGSPNARRAPSSVWVDRGGPPSAYTSTGTHVSQR